MPERRLVIVDPSHNSSVGHHHEVNRLLLRALHGGGWQPEVWADVALEAVPAAPQPLLGAFSGCDYGDPQHWQSLEGNLRLARRLESQLEEASAHGPTVQAWLGHSLLPFQLLGLARHLTQAAPAQVLLSQMFAPGETLSSGGNRQQAIVNCRIAMAALARACNQQGHQLRLGFPSRQQEQLFEPLLKATGLSSQGLHPAVVGGGYQAEAPAPGSAPMVLLHWGDLKMGKGRGAALKVLQQMLELGVPPDLQGWAWLFHSHSQAALDDEEQRLLAQASRRLPLLWLSGEQSSQTMLNSLARCPLALFAYDPEIYAERSSGLFWQWATARSRLGLPATAVGWSKGWIAEEAAALGLRWYSAASEETWLDALASASRTAGTHYSLNATGQIVLTSGFQTWCLEQLER